MSSGRGPRAETDIQREKRLLRDGYDVRSVDDVQAQVRMRIEKAQKAAALVQRLKEAMAGVHDSPYIRAHQCLVPCVDSLIGALRCAGKSSQSSRAC